MISAELKQAWTRKLRSGEFPQGSGYLCMDGAYCCLGVLCEITKARSETHSGKGVVVLSYGNPDADPVSNHAHKHMPPRSLMALWGLEYKKAIELARLNDIGSSFEDIADIIDRSDDI